jgi:chorismate mutase
VPENPEMVQMKAISGEINQILDEILRKIKRRLKALVDHTFLNLIGTLIFSP